MQKLTKIVAIAAIIGTVTGTSLCFALTPRATNWNTKIPRRRRVLCGASGYSDKDLDNEWKKEFEKGQADKRACLPNSNPYAAYKD